MVPGFRHAHVQEDQRAGARDTAGGVGQSPILSPAACARSKLPVHALEPSALLRSLGLSTICEPPSMNSAVAPPLNPPVRVLMGPGPSDIHPRVLAALGKNTVGHLDPYYLEIMNDMQRMLQSLFRTQNPMTLAISGTGSAGMEATVVNQIE